MGQKVHPIGFRLGVIRSWDSKWYEERNYAKWLHEDIKLREFVKEKLGAAGISRIEIERAANKVKINVHTARPGINQELHDPPQCRDIDSARGAERRHHRHLHPVEPLTSQHRHMRGPYQFPHPVHPVCVSAQTI